MALACDLGVAGACADAFHRAYFLAINAAPADEVNSLSRLSLTGPPLWAACRTQHIGCGVAAEGARVGLFGTPNISLARELAEIGCEAGTVLACEQLGALRGRIEGRPVLDQACDAGSPSACIRLVYTHLGVTSGDDGRMNFVRDEAYDSVRNAAKRACDLGQGEGCFWLAMSSPRSAQTLTTLETGCDAHGAFSACFGLALAQIIQARTIDEISAGVERLDAVCPLGLSMPQGCLDIIDAVHPRSGVLGEGSGASDALYIDAITTYPRLASIMARFVAPDTDPIPEALTAAFIASARQACEIDRAYLDICLFYALFPNGVMSDFDESEAEPARLIGYVDRLRTRCRDGENVDACAFFDEAASMLHAAREEIGDEHAAMIDRLLRAASSAVQALAERCLAERDGRICAAAGRTSVLIVNYDGESAPLAPLPEIKRIMQLSCEYGDLFGCQTLFDINQRGAQAFGDEPSLSDLPPNPAKALAAALDNCRRGLDHCHF